MAYCKNCGSDINEFARNCPECGEEQQAAQENRQQQFQRQQHTNYNPGQPSPDTGGFGWGLLGFCIPIVGVVLYFVWQSERPRTAKALITGALISIGLSVVSGVLNGCVSALT